MIAFLRQIAKACYHIGKGFSVLAEKLKAFCDRHENPKGDNET